MSDQVKSYSFYHRETGVIAPITFTSTSAEDVSLNSPTDHVAVDGAHDHLSKRFDLETKQVVEWIPPIPSADHVWNPETKRWQPSAAMAAKIARRTAALSRIAELEASQPKYLRGIALGKPGAAAELQKIDDEITSLEKDASWS